jgi:hypothetical protein
MAGRMRRSGRFSDAELSGEGGNKKQVARLLSPFPNSLSL